MNTVFGKPPFEDWFLALREQEQTMFRVPLNTLSLEKIRGYVKSNAIDLLLPLRYEDMRFLSLHDVGCPYLSPPNFEIVRVLNEKNLFVDLMLYNELDDFLPEIYVICTDTPKTYKPIKYPAVFKPTVGLAGAGVKILNEEADLPEGQTNYIVQEYIEGSKEYVGNYVFYRGELLFSQVMSQVYEGDRHIKHGKMLNNEIVHDFDHQQFSRIFSLLKYTGPMCIDFKLIDSKVKIFEINPRFGGTIVCNYMTDVVQALRSQYEQIFLGASRNLSKLNKEL